MQEKQNQMLKKWSKDEKSYLQLKKFVDEILHQKERKDAHIRLLESAIRNDYDSILITELTLEKPGPKIVYVNDGFCEMTGYSKDEVIGKTPRILQGPKTDEKVLKRLKNALYEGQSFFGQAINYRKDGSEFINQWDIHPLTNSAGHITHWVSYQHDISRRKRAEESFLNTKVKFDNLREASQRTIVDVDEQGSIVRANKAFRQLIGYSKDELKELKIWDLFTEKHLPALKERFEDSNLKEQFDDEVFKGIIISKTGVAIQVKGVTHLMDFKEQKLIRAEIENISFRKQVIETLQKRKEEYARMMKEGSEFTYNMVIQGKDVIIESISESFPQITGLSYDAATGKNKLSKFIHSDDLEKFQHHLHQVQQGCRSTCRYRLMNQNGNYISVMDYGEPNWCPEHKNVLSIQGSVVFDRTYQNAGY